MDPEPALMSNPKSQVNVSSGHIEEGYTKILEPEDPFSLNGPVVALIGLTIAIATVGVPLSVVLTERSLGKESLVPTALRTDGSNATLSFTFYRFGQSGGRDTRWK